MSIIHGSSVAQADVTSANIVGYQQIQVAPGWMLFCPTFKDVSKQYMDLNQIRIVKNDGSEFNTDGSKTAKGKCKGAVTINKLGDDGIYQTGYSYYSNLTKKDGVTYGAWSSDGGTPIDDNVVKLYAGEGFALNNEYKYDSTSDVEPVLMVLPAPNVK